MKRPQARGFTLIELLISAALMSMILTAAYLCLRAGFSSQELVNTRDDVLQNARVALALLTADLRAACPLTKDTDFVGMQRTLGDTRADNLDFATHNYTPRRARESDWCEVSYFLDKNPETGKLSLWRRRDATPDEDPFSGGTREELIRGVIGLKLEYYDGFDWYDEWGNPDLRRKAESSWREHPNAAGFPEAVRITLLMDPDPRRKKEEEANRSEGGQEPPLVFQTVARLNLAAASSSQGSSAGAGSSGSATPNPGAVPAGGGMP